MKTQHLKFTFNLPENGIWLMTTAAAEVRMPTWTAYIQLHACVSSHSSRTERHFA